MKNRLSTLLMPLLVLLAVPAMAAPKYAIWTATLRPADARAGEGAQIVLVVKIQKPWHMYSTTQPAGGPVKTTLELQPGSALTVAGKIVQPAPKKVMDPGFNIMTEMFSGNVAFAIPVTIQPGAKGKQTAKIKVRYQLCNESTCIPPERLELTVNFTVAPGAARPAKTKPVTTLPKATSLQMPSHPLRLASGTVNTKNFASFRQRGPVQNDWDDLSPVEGTLILAGDPTPAAPTASPPSGDAYANQLETAKSQGILPFLWFSIVAGFVALLTPCVFPMVPITVSFFAKRKESGTGTIAGPLAYCLGIIGTFTGLGLLVTFVFGASGITKFATNPIINLGLATLFIVLALNLFGVFEIAIPSGLANKAQAGTQKGGLVGPLLMGLTFTLTSFTCTAPFVGTLLVSAARGGVFYPLIGMLAFSAAFATPFFLLALFPQYLSRLPKSGSWLVTVKAFMGMLELAAALKFLSNADLVWQLGWITRPVFLAIWATIGTIAGLYLMGAVHLPHDDARKIGWIRRTFGFATMGAGVYCLAAIQGAQLGEFEPFIPPSPYPSRKVIEAAEKSPSGEKRGSGLINYRLDPVTGLYIFEPQFSKYEEALAKAKAEKKPLFVDFTGVTCTNCRLMEKNIFPVPEVRQEVEQYVTVQLYTDRETPEDDKNKAFQEKLTGVITLPVYAAISPDGKLQKVFQGLTRDPAKFVTFLQEGRAGVVAMK